MIIKPKQNLLHCIFILSIILLILIYGCAKEKDQPESPQFQQSYQTSQQDQTFQKCPDGLCDDFESSTGACPEDCGGQQNRSVQTQQMQQSQPTQQSAEEHVIARNTNSSYRIISSRPTGWFKTGQDADIMLSGIDFNNAGGPLLFNHPGSVASDGIHLLLADRNNNRVLIWNSLPTSNTPPDLVLGQKEFYSNSPGAELDQLNWPVSVYAVNGKVIVADTNNDRILIWNSFPTENGQPADVQIQDDRNNPKRNTGWPWAVWSNGEKMVVTSTASSKVLIWNKFPAQNNQDADIYLTADNKFGTPRSIGSDGNNLMIGDHNAKVNDEKGNFFWRTFPTQDQPYDFFIPNIRQTSEATKEPFPQTKSVTMGDVFWGGTFLADGKFAVIAPNLNIWNSFPENENDAPDLSVGSNVQSQGYYFESGDGSSMAYGGGRIYISLSNGNRIVVYNSTPTKSDQKPDFAIGSPDIGTNTLETNFIMSNPVPVTDGKSLFVSSDFDRKLYVWKNLPDQSNAYPDVVYELPEGPWGSAIFDKTFIAAGKKTVYIWNSSPIEGQKPDVTIKDSIGSVKFNDLKGIALDEKYFYLSDSGANKIYVWEGIPANNSEPKFILSVNQPGRLSSDGKYMADAATLSGMGGSVQIYNIDSISSDIQPAIIRGKFNLPQGALVYNGSLFVGDTGFSRVLIWKNIEDAIAGKDADVILGAESLQDTTPEIGKNKLFWPSNLAFDGSYLWVGEFKFSERLVRFSVK